MWWNWAGSLKTWQAAPSSAPQPHVHYTRINAVVQALHREQRLDAKLAPPTEAGSPTKDHAESASPACLRTFLSFFYLFASLDENTPKMAPACVRGPETPNNCLSIKAR